MSTAGALFCQKGLGVSMFDQSGERLPREEYLARLKGEVSHGQEALAQAGYERAAPAPRGVTG